MLQKLPGSGSGRQCRLRHSLSAPLCRPAHRTRTAVSRRRLPGGGAPTLGGDLLGSRCRLPVSAGRGITAPTIRLDAPKDRERLSNTVLARQPRLLILDPLIRLHRVDENDASQIAGLLSYLRRLQRTFQVAVLVVHHARKDATSTRPGQALRGS